MSTFAEVFYAARQGAGFNGVKWPADVAAWGARLEANQSMLNFAAQLGMSGNDNTAIVCQIVDALALG